jgi:hypothetical protein
MPRRAARNALVRLAQVRTLAFKIEAHGQLQVIEHAIRRYK